jgi:beta-galactosidase
MAKEIPTEIDNRWDFVNLPHCWNAIDGQDGGNDYFRGTAYYAKAFEKTDLPESGQYYLEINGANCSSDVYLNGNHLAHHDGGYSTFGVNVTDVLQETNQLVVKVDNSKNTRVYPQMADFTFYGGIYRDVEFLVIPKEHFDVDYCGSKGIKVTPEVKGDSAEIRVETFIKAQESAIVKINLLDAEGKSVARGEGTDVVLNVANPHLWNGVKDPYLYRGKLH